MCYRQVGKSKMFRRSVLICEEDLAELVPSFCFLVELVAKALIEIVVRVPPQIKQPLHAYYRSLRLRVLVSQQVCLDPIEVKQSSFGSCQHCVFYMLSVDGLFVFHPPSQVKHGSADQWTRILVIQITSDLDTIVQLLSLVPQFFQGGCLTAICPQVCAFVHVQDLGNSERLRMWQCWLDFLYMERGVSLLYFLLLWCQHVPILWPLDDASNSIEHTDASDMAYFLRLGQFESSEFFNFVDGRSGQIT